MSDTELDAITRDLNEINTFIREKFDPVTEEVTLLREEKDRVATAIAEVQEAVRANKREAAMRSGEATRLVVPEGPYAGFDMLDFSILGRFARAQSREPGGLAWNSRVDEARAALIAGINESVVMDSSEAVARALRDHHSMEISGHKRTTGQFDSAVRSWLNSMSRAAMDSTTAAAGDELVSTLEARELWMDVNLQTLVAPLIPTISMPSNPFEMPRQLGDVNFYPGTENVATTSTALATGKTTMNAYEIVGQVPFSFTLEEDAIIAMLPEIRSTLVRNVAEIIDDLILNADTTALNNINADGTTIAKTDAGKGHWLLGYDGLIHLPLIDNTSQGNDHNAAVSDDMFNEIRAKLGKYGARPSELVWIMDVNTFIRSQSITNFRTMDKLGPNATLLTGMLGAVEGIPVIVSEQMLLTAADGKVTDGTAGTVGRLLIANRTQWRQGFRREMTIDVDRDTQKRQTVVTVSFRHSLIERSGTRSSATHTGLQYNITGV